MSDIAIQVEHLGKRYRIGELQRYKALRDTLTSALHAPFRAAASIAKGRRSRAKDPAGDNTMWAIKDISFEIKQGEVVGIIGRNGAGKSTLLKVLSRITEPTEGSAQMHGRVGSLLEVGTGFHPELTGRENIYLNGAILGMRKADIHRKFDEIVAFAEVEKFIDTPVKHYSSGMFIRLAFAVAAHLEPEILLVDEVLAVGDAEFQKKCLGKMGEVAKEGRTILFVSHNLAAVASLCDRVIMLCNGSLIRDGTTESTIRTYLTESWSDQITLGEVFFSDVTLDPDTQFRLESVRTLDQDYQIRSEFLNSEPVIVEFGFSLQNQVPYLRIGFELKTASETTVFQTFHNDGSEVLTYRPDSNFRYRLRSVIPAGLLNGGMYHIDLCVGIYRRRWIIKDRRALSFNMVFDVPNPDYMVCDRPGGIAPILDWSEVQGG